MYRIASFSFPKWHWFESKSGWAYNAMKDVFLFIHIFMWIFGYTNKHINSQTLKVPLLSLLCIFSTNFPCSCFPCTLWFAHLPWQRSEQHDAAFPFDLTKICAVQEVVKCYNKYTRKWMHSHFQIVLMLENTLLSSFKMKPCISLSCTK